MINTLMLALSQSFLQEIVSNHKDEYTRTEQILISLDRLVPEKEAMWPELCRLILMQRLEEMNPDMGDDEQLDYEEAFGPQGPLLESIMKRLTGLKPPQFNSVFNYTEKVALLATLVDGVHDLRSFASILHQRVEEKTAFNKEKIDIYQAIR